MLNATRSKGVCHQLQLNWPTMSRCTVALLNSSTKASLRSSSYLEAREPVFMARALWMSSRHSYAVSGDEADIPATQVNHSDTGMVVILSHTKSSRP